MMMRYLVLVLAVLILFAGCVNPPPPSNNTSAVPIMSNTTAPQGNGTSVLQPDDTVSLGDTVLADYTLWVDGKVYDTTNATLANESGIFNPYRTYAPLNFTAQMGKGLITGFVTNVIGLHVNETVRFTVDPSRGYGNYSPSKAAIVPRYYNKSLEETVPRVALEQQGFTNLSNGTGFNTRYGMVFVQDVNDENVTLVYMSLQPGFEFTMNGLPNKVVKAENLTAVIEWMLEVNNTYQAPDPQTGSALVFRVIDKNDENITIDSNHPLAGKYLDFQVTVREFKRA